MELGIKGHLTRNNEVVKILEMLGGKNQYKIVGGLENHFYYIGDKDKYINNSYIGPDEIKGYEIFSLEDFLEKFPYKVGDKVNAWVFDDYYLGRTELVTSEIKSMRWNSARCEITYRLKDICKEFYKSDIKGKVNDEENKMNDCKKCGRHFGSVHCFDIDCPNNTPKNMEETKINQISLANCDLDKVEYKKYCGVLGYTVDDVIFTNDTGWIRITKKFWDCYANEHVYEGIGIINGHEYKDIRHHNVKGKIQLGHLKHCKDVDDVRYVNSITDDIMINQITNKVSVIKFKPDVCDNKIELQLGDYEIEVRDGKTYAVKKKPTYPKTYAECCDVLKIPNDERYTYIDVPLDYNKLLDAFTELLICRDAYWKIAGEELGLSKPWKPDFSDDSPKYNIFSYENEITLSDNNWSNRILSFPTIEMRNTFYENFKDLIKQCKELL